MSDKILYVYQKLFEAKEKRGRRLKQTRRKIFKLEPEKVSQIIKMEDFEKYIKELPPEQQQIVRDYLQSVKGDIEYYLKELIKLKEKQKELEDKQKELEKPLYDILGKIKHIKSLQPLSYTLEKLLKDLKEKEKLSQDIRNEVVTFNKTVLLISKYPAVKFKKGMSLEKFLRELISFKQQLSPKLQKALSSLLEYVVYEDNVRKQVLSLTKDLEKEIKELEIKLRQKGKVVEQFEFIKKGFRKVKEFVKGIISKISEYVTKSKKLLQNAVKDIQDVNKFIESMLSE